MKLAWLGIVAVFTIAEIAVNGEILISLSSENCEWSVRNSNDSINVRARVPGGIYTDLQNAGIIGDNLFYRFNDIDYRWIGRENWTYRTLFSLSPEIANKASVNLVLHGVDTVGSVHVNGRIVAITKNMFVRYVLPIKQYVNEGDNVLEIELKSPIAQAKYLSQNHSYEVPPKCVPSYYNGECHVNFLRKMQASFAWDWGPAFPSVGIWKPAEIEAFNAAIVRDVTTTVEDFDSSTLRVNATAYLETGENGGGNFRLVGRLSTASSEVVVTAYELFRKKDRITSVFNFMVNKSDVELWWPNGYGKQPLYRMNVTLVSEDGSEVSSKELSIGIRMVELVQERIWRGREGLTFYFRVNGVPLFAKGSNWIPSHILPELSYDEKRIRSLLMSAKEVHANTLRVWGGGLYESDLFYQIADELGLMIWQDMMYACAMYPTNEAFLETVRQETEQQIRRLQHHPSIILWAGNNENEAALRGNWYGTGHNFELYKADYVKLYVDTIKPIVMENDKTRPYVVSSPSNGILSDAEGYVALDPYSPLYGDTHFYTYILDPWNSHTYPNTRFASEYGFQSLPSAKTMSKVMLPSDRKIESQFSAKRQHLLAGYSLMTLLIKMRLPLPHKDEPDYYDTFIYYSQIAQAMGIKTETEKYRRDRNKLTKNNEGRTMGAMYWQLNDVWQAPTWSSIDFDGRWKMVHYYAKKFFSPVMISPDLTIDNRLNVFIVSDLLEDVPEAQMNITIYSWDSFHPRKVISSKERVVGSKSRIHARYDFHQLMNDTNCNETDCFVYFTLLSPDAGIDVDNILFPVSLAKVTKLQPANISIDMYQDENRNILVELHTHEIAPFVWLETDEPGQFSDNGFTLTQMTKTVTFTNRNETVDVDNFRNTLTVRSLLR